MEKSNTTSSNLIIVESPGKIKKIKGFLGPNYLVMASIGHLRDLESTSKNSMGVDIDNDFNYFTKQES